MDTLEAMTLTAALDRLRTTTSARVAVSVRALPHVFLAPVRLVERADGAPSVVVSANPATTTSRALNQVVVAIHADGIDDDGTRWEVLVQGRSRVEEPSAGGGCGCAANGTTLACVEAELIRGWQTAAG